MTDHADVSGSADPATPGADFGHGDRGRTAIPAAPDQPGSGGVARVAAVLAGVLPDDAILTDPERLRTYDCDGLSHIRVTPGLVVLPETTEQVSVVVRACVAADVPFVARGAGTGLSGGALPVADGVVIALTRMRRILHVDPVNKIAVVQPGVVNADVTAAVAGHGLYFAPDPSSQIVCTVGGNVAENSGGAHCLKHGFTVNHVLAATVVLPTGEIVELGGEAPDPLGYDLLGAFIGSEGTLGIATEITLRLTRRAQVVETLLAGFPDIGSAAATVSAVIAAGIVPAAAELMDALAVEAAEAAVGCGYPAEAGAVLLVELDGTRAEVTHALARVEEFCLRHHGFGLRRAKDEQDRAALWRGRKSAFAAVGRISPDYYVQDGVVPRTVLPEALARIEVLAREAGLRVANVFHAGDGNLHPLVLFDGAIPGAGETAERLAGRILTTCLDLGGSITGEHGVGIEKRAYLAHQFTRDDLDVMQLLRCAFDPAGLANPGKLFPTPRLCGERPGRRNGVHPLQAAGLAELF
ncbi:FAD-linked oxidase C-terminal domain-containing protein [Rhizohabitans arisaemae]|uniref:FAD-linked oxidase C-terminal domain-containing protein n=1 Tax=Rhizohabitans arisaemae TaxID=2720610 RepID=UPI0024B1FAE3|nr:FAD-linked oxidase C-terminal domain-containing protein [Rhizohabitans arisaemae]